MHGALARTIDPREPWLHFRATRAEFQWIVAVCPISRYTFEREREREVFCSWNFFKSKHARRGIFRRRRRRRVGTFSRPPSEPSKQVWNGNSFRARTTVRRWFIKALRAHIAGLFRTRRCRIRCLRFLRVRVLGSAFCKLTTNTERLVRHRTIVNRLG